MKLICPSCGLTASAEAWINDAAARDLLLAVATLPAPLPKVVLPYLAIFRPERQALRWDKAGKIVAELAGMIALGHVQVQGKVARPCPPRIWAAAMEQMVERRDSIRRPLPNHNYLKQVAWQLADEEDGRNEAATEQRRKQNSASRGHSFDSGRQIDFRGKDCEKKSAPSGCGPTTPNPLLNQGGVLLSPMDAYVQGLRDDKPSMEEMQEWSREKLR